MLLQIVFVPGGHGIMFDGPGNKKLAAVLTEAYASGVHANHMQLLLCCASQPCFALPQCPGLAHAPAAHS